MTQAATPALTMAASDEAALFRRYRWQVFAATWLSYAGFYVTRKVFSVVKNPLKHALGIDDDLLSYLFTAYLVTYMLGQFATAFLSRRFTSRQLLLVGMSVSATCNVAMGACLPLGRPAYPLLMALMAIHGFAQATGWGCNVGLMANWTRHAERGQVMGVWSTCYQLGGVAAKALAAFLLGWLGLLWPFFGSSVVLAFVIVVFFFGARERPEDHGLPALNDPSPIEQAQKADTSGKPGGFGLIIALGLTYFGMKFLRYALDSWSPEILAEQFHVADSTAGYLSTAFDWFGFAGVIVAGWVSDKFFRSERIPVIAWMSAGCFVGTLLLAFVGSSSLIAFVALIGWIGFMEMGPDALLSGAAAMDTGSRRRAVMAAGIINGLGSAGPIVQEPTIGWLKTHFGVEAVLLLLVAMGVLSAAATGLLWFGTRRAGIRL